MDQPPSPQESQGSDNKPVIIKPETQEEDQPEAMEIDTVTETVTSIENNSSPLVIAPESNIDSTIPTTATSSNTTVTTSSTNEQTSQEQQQHLQDLETINQLQQMSAAQTQALASAAAAALGNQNFQLFAGFDSNALAASVIAAAANANANANNNNNTTNTTSPSNTSSEDLLNQQQSINNANNQQQQQQQQQQSVSQIPTEILKRELMNQKVRADNRERKKRWRQQNEERNKDNDLRCRVNKRAHKLFGKEDSDHKKKWIDDEFLKRQQKRKDKERRKGLVDDSLSAHHAITGASNTNNPSNSIDMLSHQIAAQPSIAGLNEVNYLTLLCNNLGIPAAARSLIGSHNLNTLANTTAEDSTHATSDNTSESQQPQQQPDQQHQQDASTATNSEHTEAGGDSKDNKVPFPFQLLEILQQLQQYQPQQQTTSEANEGAGNEFHLSADQQPFGNNLLGDDARPEEKLAALLTSTLQAANAAAVASTSVKEEDVEGNKENGSSSENTNEAGEHQAQQQQNNAEFPMDAVLTLMQLNAGWRQ